MKEKTQTIGLEVRGSICNPHRQTIMKTHKRRAFMQQAVKQNACISSMSTHMLDENMTIKMNRKKDSLLKYDQDNIQAK